MKDVKAVLAVSPSSENLLNDLFRGVSHRKVLVKGEEAAILSSMPKCFGEEGRTIETGRAQ